MVTRSPAVNRPRSIGRSVPKKDAAAKVTGAALYVDDLSPEGLLHGATVRSEIPAGRITRIEFDSAFDWSQVTIVDHRDIPGNNCIALIEYDQPALVENEIRHADEPILLLAHPDREKLQQALRAVKVHCEPLEAVLTMERSIACARLVHATDNVQKRFLIQRGDLEAGFARAHKIVEREYRVGHQEHLYIENNGVIARMEADGSLVVEGSLQCPYYVHKALMHLMGLPAEKVRVVQTVTGGGFGGKEEYPSMISAHAALLARKSGRPVKLIYDRMEDIAATTKRHPAIVRHRSGVTEEGELVAQDIDVIMDGGAYVTLSPVVLSRGILHAGGPYRCPNVRITGRAVATNTPPNGAFRGFGAPQTLFAAELHMDHLAESLGMDPLEIRRRNLYRLGDVTPTGQVLRESVSASECLEKAVKVSGYVKRRKALDAANRKALARPAGKGPRKVRGIGLSLVHHGAGFTGSGEVKLASIASLDLSPEGRPRALAASTEIGQGTVTIFSQMIGDALQVSHDLVEVAQPDTLRVPNSGPTVASRTCMVVGGLLSQAAADMRARLLEFDPRGWSDDRSFRKLALRHLKERGALRIDRQYQPPSGIEWNDDTYTGDAYGVFAWACNVIEVEVDLDTGDARPVEVVTANDVGKAIHPRLAEGQIEGGVSQALGWAILEELRWKDGRVWNQQLTNYIIPTSMDCPPMKVIVVENPYSGGPFGAKGVGELPMDGPAPAVVAAVRHATGQWMDEIPISPERLLEKLARLEEALT